MCTSTCGKCGKGGKGGKSDGVKCGGKCGKGMDVNVVNVISSGVGKCDSLDVKA